MNGRLLYLAGWMLLWPAAAVADEVRYYTQDGITYRETRRLVQRPVTETHTQQRTEVAYREQWSTEQREGCRVWWVPVTEYRYETYWAGIFNPFITPYLAARYIPYTRWEMRTEKVTVPLHVRKVVPETKTIETPVITQRMVTEEYVERTPINPLSRDTHLAGSGVPTLAPLSTRPTTPLQPLTPQYANAAPAYGANQGGAAPPASLSAPQTPHFTSPAPPSTLTPEPSRPNYAPPGGFTPTWVAPQGSAASGMYPSAQRQTLIGGISRLDQDPPRHGVNGWRPSGTILR